MTEVSNSAGKAKLLQAKNEIKTVRDTLLPVYNNATPAQKQTLLSVLVTNWDSATAKQRDDALRLAMSLAFIAIWWLIMQRKT